MRSISNARAALAYLRRAPVDPNAVRAFGDLIDEAESSWRTSTGGEVFTATQGSLAYSPNAAPPAAPNFVNYNTSFLAPFVIANTSTQILPQNNKRTLLLIQNLSSSSDLYFALGGGASINNGILLAADQGIVFDSVCPTDSLNVFFNNASPQQGIVMEVRFTPS